MIDTGSDSSIFSDNIAELVEELLDIKLNRKKKNMRSVEKFGYAHQSRRSFKNPQTVV